MSDGRAGDDLVGHVIARIYDAACDGSRWPETLELLSRASGSLCATHFLWRKDKEALDFFVGSKGYTGDDDYRASYSAIDPRRQLSQRLPEGGILRCHEHLDREYVANSPFYQDFSLKHDRRFLMSTHLIKTDQVSCFAVLHRTAEQGAFTEKDRNFLKVLHPHLRRAAQIHTRMEELEAARRSARATLDQLSFGVITANEQGRVMALNRVAEEVARSSDGLAIRSGRLIATGEAGPRLAEAIRLATMALPTAVRQGGSVLVGRPSGRPAYRVLVAPNAEPGTALMFISDPERVSAPRQEHLRALFGMTSAEAQVAMELTAGKRLEDIAEERAVSMGTVRSQLKSLLHKTGTDRQSELVRTLLTIPTINPTRG